MQAYRLKIKDIPPSQRPRERLFEVGARSLKDSELLAILLRSGTGKESVLELSERVLSDCNGDLGFLAARPPEALVKEFKGIGPAKAAELCAAFELGRRANGLQPGSMSKKIEDSESAFHELKSAYQNLAHEEFWVLLLNASGKVLGKQRISQGGANQTAVEAADVLRPAIAKSASGLILSHNHPGGSTKPSPEDIHLTKAVMKAAQSVDIQILDHLIVCGNKYLSMLDEELMPEI